MSAPPGARRVTPAASPGPVRHKHSETEIRAVGRLIKHVLASLLRRVDQRMQPLGLTAMQWEPLALIYYENVDTVAALARESHVNCGSMTRMLDRLEAKDLLRRRRSETDRRVVHLELTAKGREVAQAIRPLAVEELRHYLDGFTTSEVSLLTQLLERMLANGQR